MRRNSETYDLVSLVQMSGSHVRVVIQEARDGIVYPTHGWDIEFLRILKMASRFRLVICTPSFVSMSITGYIASQSAKEVFAIHVTIHL